MEEIKSGTLFGCVHRYLKAPEHLKAYFANFLPFFKNDVVSIINIGDLMKENGNFDAEKERIIS